MKIPFHKIEAVINGENNVGFCLNCGAEKSQCEPDARNYPCDECGENRVFGAEEVLMMGEVDTNKMDAEEDGEE